MDSDELGSVSNQMAPKKRNRSFKTEASPLRRSTRISSRSSTGKLSNYCRPKSKPTSVTQLSKSEEDKRTLGNSFSSTSSSSSETIFSELSSLSLCANNLSYWDVLESNESPLDEYAIDNVKRELVAVKEESMESVNLPRNQQPLSKASKREKITQETIRNRKHVMSDHEEISPKKILNHSNSSSDASTVKKNVRNNSNRKPLSKSIKSSSSNDEIKSRPSSSGTCKTDLKSTSHESNQNEKVLAECNNMNINKNDSRKSIENQAGSSLEIEEGKGISESGISHNHKVVKNSIETIDQICNMFETDEPASENFMKDKVGDVNSSCRVDLKESCNDQNNPVPLKCENKDEKWPKTNAKCYSMTSSKEAAEAKVQKKSKSASENIMNDKVGDINSNLGKVDLKENCNNQNNPVPLKCENKDEKLPKTNVKCYSRKNSSKETAEAKLPKKSTSDSENIMKDKEDNINSSSDKADLKESCNNQNNPVPLKCENKDEKLAKTNVKCYSRKNSSKEAAEAKLQKKSKSDSENIMNNKEDDINVTSGKVDLKESCNDQNNPVPMKCENKDEKLPKANVKCYSRKTSSKEAAEAKKSKSESFLKKSHSRNEKRKVPSPDSSEYASDGRETGEATVLSKDLPSVNVGPLSAKIFKSESKYSSKRGKNEKVGSDLTTSDKKKIKNSSKSKHRPEDKKVNNGGTLSNINPDANHVEDRSDGGEDSSLTSDSLSINSRSSSSKLGDAVPNESLRKERTKKEYSTLVTSNEKVDSELNTSNKKTFKNSSKSRHRTEDKKVNNGGTLSNINPDANRVEDRSRSEEHIMSDSGHDSSLTSDSFSINSRSSSSKLGEAVPNESLRKEKTKKEQPTPLTSNEKSSTSSVKNGSRLKEMSYSKLTNINSATNTVESLIKNEHVEGATGKKSEKHATSKRDVHKNEPATVNNLLKGSKPKKRPHHQSSKTKNSASHIDNPSPVSKKSHLSKSGKDNSSESIASTKYIDSVTNSASPKNIEGVKYIKKEKMSNSPDINANTIDPESNKLTLKIEYEGVSKQEINDSDSQLNSYENYMNPIKIEESDDSDDSRFFRKLKSGKHYDKPLTMNDETSSFCLDVSSKTNRFEENPYLDKEKLTNESFLNGSISKKLTGSQSLPKKPAKFSKDARSSKKFEKSKFIKNKNRLVLRNLNNRMLRKYPYKLKGEDFTKPMNKFRTVGQDNNEEKGSDNVYHGNCNDVSINPGSSVSDVGNKSNNFNNLYIVSENWAKKTIFVSEREQTKKRSAEDEPTGSKKVKNIPKNEPSTLNKSSIVSDQSNIQASDDSSDIKSDPDDSMETKSISDESPRSNLQEESTTNSESSLAKSVNESELKCETPEKSITDEEVKNQHKSTFEFHKEIDASYSAPEELIFSDDDLDPETPRFRPHEDDDEVQAPPRFSSDDDGVPAPPQLNSDDDDDGVPGTPRFTLRDDDVEAPTPRFSFDDDGVPVTPRFSSDDDGVPAPPQFSSDDDDGVPGTSRFSLRDDDGVPVTLRFSSDDDEMSTDEVIKSAEETNDEEETSDNPKKNSDKYENKLVSCKFVDKSVLKSSSFNDEDVLKFQTEEPGSIVKEGKQFKGSEKGKSNLQTKKVGKQRNSSSQTKKDGNTSVGYSSPEPELSTDNKSIHKDDEEDIIHHRPWYVFCKEVYYQGESLHGFRGFDDGCDYLKIAKSRKLLKESIINDSNNSQSSELIVKMLRPLCRDMLMTGCCENKLLCSKKHEIRKECFNHMQLADVLIVLDFVLKHATKVSDCFMVAIFEFLGLYKAKSNILTLSSYVIKWDITDVQYTKVIWNHLFKALQACGFEKWEAIKTVIDHNFTLISSLTPETISKMVETWNLQSMSVNNCWYIIEPLTKIEGFKLGVTVLSKVLGEVLEIQSKDVRKIYLKMAALILGLPSEKLSLISNRLLNDFVRLLKEKHLIEEAEELREKISMYNAVSYRSYSPDFLLTSSKPTSSFRRCKSVGHLPDITSDYNEDVFTNDKNPFKVYEEEKMTASLLRALDSSNYNAVVSTIISCANKNFIVNLLTTAYNYIMNDNPLVKMKKILKAFQETPQSEEYKLHFGSLLITFIVGLANKFEWKVADDFFSLFALCDIPKYEVRPLLSGSSYSPVRVAILYSEVHFYNERYKEAIGVVIDLKLINPPDEWMVCSTSEKDSEWIQVMVNFLLTELLYRNVTDVAVMLFKRILEAQVQFDMPIDLNEYFEPLLYKLFELSDTHPQSAVKLYIRVCKRGVSVSLCGLTVRALLILALRAKKTSTVTELFQRGINEYAYPIFEEKEKTISLLRSFTEEEMYVYISEWFVWFRKKLHDTGTGTAAHEVIVQFKSADLEDFLDNKTLGIPAILREVDESVQGAMKRLDHVIRAKCKLQVKKARRETIIIDHVSLANLLDKLGKS